MSGIKLRRHAQTGLGWAGPLSEQHPATPPQRSRSLRRRHVAWAHERCTAEDPGQSQSRPDLRRSRRPRWDTRSYVVLQPQIVPADEIDDLPYLVGLGLSARLLDVQELSHTRASEDAMAAAAANFAEAQRLDETNEVEEGDIPNVAAENPPEKLGRPHVATVARPCDRTFGGSRSPPTGTRKGDADGYSRLAWTGPNGSGSEPHSIREPQDRPVDQTERLDRASSPSSSASLLRGAVISGPTRSRDSRSDQRLWSRRRSPTPCSSISRSRR